MRKFVISLALCAMPYFSDYVYAQMPLLEGQCIVTHAPGELYNIDLPTPTFPVLQTADCRNLGTSGTTPITPTLYAHPDWVFGAYASGGKTDKLGAVFGLATDKNKNVYVTHYSYGVFASGGAAFTFPWSTDSSYPSGVFRSGNGGAGTVYKIDSNTGAVSVLATLPNSLSIPTFNHTSSASVSFNDGYGTTAPLYYADNTTLSGPGLGNIAYDHKNNQLFVSNFEDGKVYRLSMAGAQLSTFDPLSPDDNMPGYAPLGERVWGIAYNKAENRVYYAIWKQGFGDAVNLNPIRSVALTAAGDFDASSDRFEFNAPLPTGSNARNGGDGTAWVSSPISDIEFSQDGQTMLIAGKEMIWHWSERGHSGISMSYKKTGASWTADKTYYVGEFLRSTNSAGGIAFGYSQFDSGTNSVVASSKEQLVWVSGNSIHLPFAPAGSGKFVYGAQGIPVSGNTAGVSVYNNTWNFDYNGEYLQNNKGHIGDMEVFATLASCNLLSPSVKVTCNNGGNDTNASNDYLTFQISPVGENNAVNYNISVGGVAVSPISGSYGTLTTFTLPAGSAGGGNLTATITDASDSSCSTTTQIIDTGACSTTPVCMNITNVTSIWALNETDGGSGNNTAHANVEMCTPTCAINTPTVTPTCNNNGTASDPSDDTFTFTISATGSNTGANYKVDKISPAPTATVFASVNYGTTSAASPSYPISGGNLTLTLTDNTTTTCTRTPVTVTAPPTCSSVVPTADLELTKTSSSPVVRPGDTLTYTLTLVNKGPGTANGVVVRDVIPAGLTFVSATTATGSYSNATGLWTVGNIAPGTYTLTINVTVN